ncbi:type II toxin-antitoxin system Phd/YefM family antitoxin [Levilactobacillus cerevisiae]|uniref:type II toxin-antitoxin system Phd/YefM family antitoxin n=1 Tax=Levilactobacillus cerevisiae TaxID=1704076 RepID=UPI000F7A90B3|nr:type II toxin-antitoxin system Phd/YefM family antitoxin [Levilactobacillus cerevisiae]
MIATTYSDFKNHLKTHLNQVTDDCEPLTVVRKHKPNVVVISADMYANLLENLHVQGNATNLAWLEAAKLQLASGQSQKPDQAGSTDAD